MKKLASGLLAFLLLAQPLVDVAAAKVLVVEDRGATSSSFNDEGMPEVLGTKYLREVVASILRSYSGLRQGTDYDIIGAPAYGVTPTLLRDGKVTLWNGTSAAVNKTYDAVIIVGNHGLRASGSWMRADSLVKWQNSSRYNTVPIMFVNYGSNGNTAASDSCVFGDDVTHLGTMGQVMYSTKDPSLRYRAGTNKTARLLNAAVGKYRVIIGSSQGKSEGTQQDISGAGITPIPCLWCDSVYTTAPGTGDSAIVWVRYMDHINGAKPIIFTQTNDYAPVSTNIPAIWSAMAFLDSLTNGGVFGSAEAPSFGVLVPGLASRGTALGYPTSTLGIPPDDTSNTYRSVDSLATLGVPIAFGAPVNLDSITTYKRDIQRVMDKSARFSLFPFSRYGIDTSAAAIGAGRTATTKYQPQDIFGAWRNRTAIGDGTFAGKDSSTYAHVLRAFGVHDSLYAGRVDHVLYAPLDDWLPKNYASVGLDSLASAFVKGGARAVVTNFRLQLYDNGRTTTQTRAAVWNTRRVNAPYAQDRLNVFAASPLDSGAARFDNGNGQTGSGGGFNTFRAIDQFWSSFIGARAFPTYGYADQVWTADSSDAGGRVRLLVVPMASFGSGTRADRCCLPTRPGWWYTKAIVNGAKVVNMSGLPGRTYIRIAKAEDVRP